MVFKVTCQYAHQAHEESTDLGMMSDTVVLKSFDEFGWTNQILEANRLGKVSPTLSVEDSSTRRLIWVSAYGDEAHITFVSECSFPGMKKRLFGLLSEAPGVIELHTDQFDMRQARRALEFFVTNNENDLRELYK